MSRAIVVMGPSGNGKSTLGKALADHLGRTFIEGDNHHPPANLAKMANGIPLTDADRAPFLAAIGQGLVNSPHGAVAACSALRRIYRDQLRASARDILFVLPLLDRESLRYRLSNRLGHFMPVTLLDSQLSTLEMPDADERNCIIDGKLPTVSQLAAVLDHLA